MLFTDLLTLHVKESGAKNCYNVPGIARTSRVADFAESRLRSRDATHDASQRILRSLAIPVESCRQKNLAH